MKQLFTKAAPIIVFLFLQFSQATAQDLTGIWRGYFVTENYEHYKFELQIRQKGNTVTGVSYSYLSTVFYGKATLTGTYNKAGKKFMVQEIKTVELRMSSSSQACIMKCMFEYAKSGKEEFLEGTYGSIYEKDGALTKRGENCGGGKVYLRRVTESDFYIEPFLRGKIKPGPVLVNKAPVKKSDTAAAKPVIATVKPPVKKVTIPAKPVVKKSTTNNLPVPLPPVKKDSVVAKFIPPKKFSDSPSVRIKQMPVPVTPPDIKNRQNELVKTLLISSKTVTVKLYDNGEIDGDTISVYLDKRLVLSEKRLTASPLVITFNMDEDQTDHELTMVAENLGTIPPNTSLMIVEAGSQRFEVRITSTEQRNAVVKFRYQQPK